MGVSSMMGFLLNLIFVILHFQIAQSATVVVDGVSEWRNPTVQIGDSVIFQHKYHYNLYIFQTREAFSLCNFTRATLLTKANSTSYIWHPSRTGFFYFSFNNGSTKACQEGQKLAIKVTLSAPPENQASSPPDLPPVSAPPQSSGGVVSSSPAFPPENHASSPPDLAPVAAPSRSSGGVVSSSPAFPWPYRPRETSSPSPAPSEMFPAMSPMVPDKSGIPFINSNPAVPLPTGEVDSATIRPIPISGSHERQVVKILAVQRALCCVILIMLL